MRKRGYIALLVGLLGLAGCERDTKVSTAPSPSETAYPITGFDDYDWLPDELKHAADHLVRMNPNHLYRFHYYFDTDDINRHFYIDDPGLIITQMPVTNEHALERIDDQLHRVEARKRGVYVAHDTVDRRGKEQKDAPWQEHKSLVFYVLPKNSADFSGLRIALVRDTISESATQYVLNDPTVYDMNEVDTPPRPIRGLEYFKKAVIGTVRSAALFVPYDTGTVEVEFIVSRTTDSPNIIRGFSSQDSTYEAYQVDGEILKAIQHAKVWWRMARKDGQPVRTRMRMSFDIAALKK